ncbi:MFS transporter [Desulfonema magnum]|uniref:Major facilitator superfamily transporter n=1 Tax=Desulfonema magnum TaxID=45655 RepID=A0A975C0F6_9BACT|nr:MFS transporter [Desulfonema magnum]QTA93918.1 Major facilitator superfamily transporter [Desulfonema magnum]
MKLKLIISALVLLVFALGFNALLSLSSLKKLYIESVASKYGVIGKDLQRNIQTALRFGKNIRKFIGMDKLLQETKSNLVRKINTENTSARIMADSISEAEIAVSVSLSDGIIFYSTEEKLKRTRLPSQVQMKLEDAANEKKNSPEPCYVRCKDTYFIILPVYDWLEKKQVAGIIITFDEKQMKDLFRSVIINNVKVIAIILLSGFVLLIILLNIVIPDRPDVQKFPKLKIYLVIFFVIGFSQIIFTGLNTNEFKNHYLKISTEKAVAMVTLLKEDIEYLLNKGIRISKLVKADVLMGEIISAAPELEHITITDNEGHPLYMATKKSVRDFQKSAGDGILYTDIIRKTDPEYHLIFRLQKDGRTEGYISANISKKVLFAKLKKTALDSATVLIISTLFFVELLIIFFQFLQREFAGIKGRMMLRYGVIRPAAFLLFFGMDVSTSFLPLHMEKLYEPIFGLSKDIVMGLPISVEIFFSGVSVIIAGSWTDRRGWHEPFLSGLLLVSGGYVWSWLATDATEFILSRGIAGLGYGFSLVACQNFVVSYTDEKNRSRGFAQMFAGAFAGSICGCSAGAILAERIGYSFVFAFGSVIILIAMGYTIIFMRKAFRKPYRIVEDLAPPLKIRQLFHFLSDRRIFSLIVFSSIPASIAMVGFINYFYPIYLNRIGTSQSDIGRIYMIYGLCLIYVGPFFSKYVDASENKKVYIVLTGILGSLGFINFYFFGGLPATALTVFLLGLSGSANVSRVYALKLGVTRELGTGRAIGIFTIAEKTGQVIAPMVFGWLIAETEFHKGLIRFGVAYLFATMLFMFLSRGDRKICKNYKEAG